MKPHGELRIDPGAFETSGSGEVEIVVPYTEWEVTDLALKRAVALTTGLNARISLIAVHTVPYPSTFGCAASVHAFLVEQLLDLACRCPLPVSAQVVLARSQFEGFTQAIKGEPIVLVGSRKRILRTYEERLARMLASRGHQVSLIHVDSEAAHG